MAQLGKDSSNPFPEPLGWALAGVEQQGSGGSRVGLRWRGLIRNGCGSLEPVGPLRPLSAFSHELVVLCDSE